MNRSRFAARAAALTALPIAVAACVALSASWGGGGSSSLLARYARILAPIAAQSRLPEPQRLIGTPSPSQATLDRVARELEQTQQRRLAAAKSNATGNISIRANAVTPGAFERRPGSVLVRVYFHVIQSSSLNNVDNGFVSDQQIIQQIRALNIAFSGAKTLPDGTRPRGFQNTPFRFVLAGVDRTIDDDAFDISDGFGALIQNSQFERDFKRRLYRGSSRDLNIYTGVPVATDVGRFDADPLFDPTATVLGYATYPWEYPRYNVTDGISIDFRSLPPRAGDDTSFVAYNQGMTAVRCVGNWLGLLSTFEGGCTARNDQVTDTNAERFPYLGGDWRTSATGQPERDTCTGRNYPGPDPVENFMDYTQDAFMYRFTRGQSQRMDSSAITYRYL